MKTPIINHNHLVETDNKIIKRYAVTGSRHGSIVLATSEGQARRLFHSHYGGESIHYIKLSYYDA